jgi:competence protein ComEC
VITHPHKNHFEGYFHILENFPVKRLYINGDKNSEDGYEELLALFRQQSVPINNLKRGDQIKNLPDSVKIAVLHPAQLSGNVNDNSMVLWLKHKDVSVLFMADIGPHVQKELLRLYQDIQEAEIIQIPHHGGPVSEDFIDTFKDKIFIVSTGANQWGWPNENELQKLKGKIYRTDHDRTIVIESDGLSVLVKTPGSGKE